jgi:hypothetical protein
VVGSRAPVGVQLCDSTLLSLYPPVPLISPQFPLHRTTRYASRASDRCALVINLVGTLEIKAGIARTNCDVRRRQSERWTP